MHTEPEAISNMVLDAEEINLMKLLQNGSRPIEECLYALGIEKSEALDSIRRLIAKGQIRLTIIIQPWGTEYQLAEVRAK